MGGCASIPARLPLAHDKSVRHKIQGEHTDFVILQVPDMRSHTLIVRLQTPLRLSTCCRLIHSSTHIMDISSGNVSFGRTCPGVLMEDFRLNMPSSVANIKKLELSFSRYRVFEICAVGCTDLAIVRNFISSIENLEDLSVINYEPDASVI